MLPQHPVLSRRDLLQAGMLGLLGLGIPQLDALRAMAGETRLPGERRLKAKSVVLVFLNGGLSQLDSFDPKPAAPAEIRGEFVPIATATPGIQICEHLPHLARTSGLWSMCRSLTHQENAHGPACHSILTGRTKLPPGSPEGCGAPPTPNDWPSIAAQVAYCVNARNNLPPAIVFPAKPARIGLRPGQSAGRMGSQWDPWYIEPTSSAAYGCLPNAYAWASSEQGEHVVPYDLEDHNFFRPPSLVLPDDMGQDRFAQRIRLLDALQRQQRQIERAADEGSFDAQRQKAVALLAGSDARRALFDVTNAPAKEQDRYGRNEWGWLMLLARRLVEADVPLIQVTLCRNAGWDTHRDNFRLLRDYLLPPFDFALAGFLSDLKERALIDQTLVVVLGEFGRTPKIVRHEQGRSQPGRDHWSRVQTALLAGGGIPGGVVIGSSDKTGGEPASSPQTPENLGATIYHALGIPRDVVWHPSGDESAQADAQRVYQGRPIFE